MKYASLLVRLLLVCAVPFASAQTGVFLVEGGSERPAPAIVDLGGVYPTESASAQFRIRNTSAAPAPIGVPDVKGTGFTLTGLPVLPAVLDPQQAFDFSVVFQSTATGSYSAVLNVEGAAVLITAAVLPRLTVQVQTAAAAQTLGPAPVDFGSVLVAAPALRRFVVTNLTGLVLQAPAIAVQGDAFRFVSPSPSGAVFRPGDSATFDVVFQPSAPGAAAGALIIGDRTYALAGNGLRIPLPRPSLDIELPQAQSGQQGTIAVDFDAAAQTAGTGTLTLDFQPLPDGATDTAIQLGTAGRSLSFAVAPGDTQYRVGTFQTGTTAGTLVFTVTLGDVTDRKSVTLPPAPVAVTSAVGARAAGSIELDIAGYDNTRTVGTVVYTFYDASGSAIAQPITVDNTRDFAAYFAASNVGGNFLLRAVFPITGEASRIAAFEVQLTNSAGPATTGSINF